MKKIIFILGLFSIAYGQNVHNSSVTRKSGTDSIFYNVTNTFAGRDTLLGVYSQTGGGGVLGIDSTQQIGTMYDSSTWNNLSSFNAGTNVSVVSNKIHFAVDPGTNQALLFPYATMLDAWNCQFDFHFTTLDKTQTTTNYGYNIGLQSIGNVSQSQLSLFFYLDIQSGTGNFGKAVIVSSFNGTGTNYLSSGALTTLSVSDNISYIVNFNADTCTYTVKNNTTSQTVSVQVLRNFAYSGSSGVTYNTANFGFYSAGMTTNAVTLDRIYWGSKSIKNAALVTESNSIGNGSYAGSSTGRFASQIHSIIHSGSGDITNAFVQNLHELIYVLQPKSVLLDATGNDAGFGISTTTTHNNLIAVHDSLVAHGINVYWLFSTPRNAVNVTTLNSWVSTNYPGQYIDVYTPLWSGSGTSMNATYNSGDGVHPNLAGHNLMAATIEASPLYKNLTTYIKYYGSGVDGSDPYAIASVSYARKLQDSIKNKYFDISSYRDGYVIALDSVNNKFKLVAAGTGSSYITSLTTTGTSGAATVSSGVLNIPQYSGGGGTPGGSTTQIQYNNAGAFGGDAAWVFNSGTAAVTLRKDQNAQTGLTVDNRSTGTSAIATFTAQNGTVSSQYGIYGTSATAYGGIGANTSYLYTSGTKLFFMADNASGELDFGAGTAPSTQVKMSAGGLFTFAAPTTTMSTINLPTGTAKTSPVQGDLFATTGHLYYRDQSTTYDLLTSGGSGTPGGATTQIQYNNAGAFGGDAAFVFAASNAAITQRKDQNAATTHTIDNRSTGTGASAVMTVQNGTYNMQLGSWGTSATAYGGITSGNGYLYSNAPNMFIMNDNASGVIKIGVGSSPSAQITVGVGGMMTHVTPTTTIASVNFPAGTAKTSPSQGDMYATTGHLYYRDQSTTYDLLSGGGSTPSLSAVTAVGATTSTALTLSDVTLQHLITSSTIGATSSLGTNVTSATVSGHDGAYILTVVTSGNVSGTICVVTFGTAYASAPVAMICEKQWQSAVNSFGIGALTTTNTIAGSITGSGTYSFNIYNIQ